MPYQIAGVDLHKRMLTVVVADVEVSGEYEFVRCQFSSSPDQLQRMTQWLREQAIEEMV